MVGICTRIGVLAILGLTSPTLAAAQPGIGNDLKSVVLDEQPWPKKTEPLRFEPLSNTFGGKVQVTGGFPIDESDFPATARSTAPGGSCTATLVGPRVLLTAAHCVDRGLDQAAADAEGLPMENSGKVRFDAEFDLVCKMHPSYSLAPAPSTTRPRTSEDWALCELSGKPARVAETIATSTLSVGQRPYFILGFGCAGVTKVNGKLVPTDGGGKLLAGSDTLLEIGVGTQPGSSGHFAVTRADIREPSLCPGDSGGGAFDGPNLSDPKAKRRVTMVNSALGSTGEGATLVLYSYFASLASAEFKDFAKSWAGDRAERRICGLHLKAGEFPCRP
jgi:hypothetical protein